MIKKNQHTIPKFLLKNWGDQFINFDIKTRTTHYSDPQHATVVHFYYEDESREINEIEDLLSKIEGKAAPIIKKLVESEKEIELTNLEMVNLVIFFETLSIRSLRSENIGKEIPRDKYEQWGKMHMAPKSKKHQLDLITELMEVDWTKIFVDYKTKHRQKMDGILLNNKMVQLMLDEEYKHWDYKEKYSINILRTLIDWGQRKIGLLESSGDNFILGDAVSSGSRNSSGNMNYFAYPISPRRTLIFYLFEYATHELFKKGFVPFFDQFKKMELFEFNAGMRINFITDEQVDNFKTSSLINFYRAQESTSFLIFCDDGSSINAVRNLHEIFKLVPVSGVKFKNIEQLVDDIIVFSK